MRLLVIGGGGMLGSDVVAQAEARGWAVVAPPLEEFDLSNPMDAAKIAAQEWGSVDACVNCAAYTAVDRAEEEKELAYAINALGPGYLARACSAVHVRLIHVSTDFVFDGTKGSAYVPEDEPNPLNVYGASKLAGEEAALAGSMETAVIRTSWLYGTNGNSFPRSMIRAWQAGKTLRVVDDQFGTPTYTGELARVILDALERRIPSGLYHAAGPETMTWHELAVRTLRAMAPLIADGAGPIAVGSIRTEDWPTQARRPSYSALDSHKLWALGIEPMGPVDASLAAFCSRLSEREGL